MESAHIAMLIALAVLHVSGSRMGVRGTVFWGGVWVFAVATGLASMIFMALAFYLEINGGGATFIEPNRVIAAAELATVATGMVALLVLFAKSIGRMD